MAIVLMHWGRTGFANPSGITLEYGDSGYAVQGGLVSTEPTEIRAEYFLEAARNDLGPVNCVSAPVAVFSGTITGNTGGSLLGSDKPRSKSTHTLTQRVFINDTLVEQASQDEQALYVSGDNKEGTVQLGVRAFPPCAFTNVTGAAVRVELLISIVPGYKNTRPGSVAYNAMVELPQWGLITGVHL